MNAFKQITFRQILALLLCAAIVIFDGFVVKSNFQSENKELVFILVGSLNTALGTIINYYFGSSHKGTTAPDTTTVEVIRNESNKQEEDKG